VDELHHRFEFYTGISNTGTVELNNGLFGAIPEHPILADLIHEISKWHNHSQLLSTNDFGSTAKHNSPLALIAEMAGPVRAAALTHAFCKTALTTIECTGPGLFTRIFMRHLLQKNGGDVGEVRKYNEVSAKYKIAALPASFFYPMPNNEGNSNPQEFIQPESFAVHHWARSWQAAS
jgi:hypothetical protein